MFSSLEKLSNTVVYSLIVDTEEDRAINWPPMKPKNGDVYLFSYAHDPNCHQNYVSDGFSWENQGVHKAPSKDPFLKKRYYKRVIGGKKVNFTKQVTELLDRTHQRVLIHYLGDDDQIIEEAPHGNRVKNTSREHLRTMPSVLKTITESNFDPGKTYKTMVTNPSVPSSSFATGVPRNRKQIENKQYNEKKSKAVDRCGIYGTIEMNEELSNFVTDLTLIPHLRVIMVNENLLSMWSRQACDVKCNVLSYDTTYGMGDFYVSTLIARHCHFENAPAFVIGVLIHHSRDAESHEVFFRRMRKMSPCLDKENVVIVTDREAGTRKALKEVFTTTKLFSCWNHIKSDVKRFLHVHKVPQNDRSTYMNHISSLLRSNSTEDFISSYKN